MTTITKCLGCGAQLPSDSTFCEQCGAPVIQAGVTDFTRLRQLFDQAQSIDPSQRDTWLQHQCQGNATMLNELRNMLAGTAVQGSFLQKPAEFPPSLLGISAATPPPNPPPGAAGQQSGYWVGPYRIVKELGRGGMGVVFLALRDDGTFRKNVALKLLLNEQVSPEFVQRFKQERQVLAAMDHPNIARILDGGDAPNGMPFYVMEYVDGMPVDSHCNAQRLGLTARIKIFQQICHAVQYLHHNSIVHRDLKPSNILVSNDGVAKLLDFGIAKVVGAAAYAHPDVTGVQGTPLTPNYASPEQVRGQTLQKPSDIYSLGVILYQLLTGRLPYDSWEDKLSKFATRGEPAPPSSNIREDLKSSPQSTASLRKSMMGDLDSIVLKAMRLDPKDRYASAADLADDLQRFLDGQAVTSHHDTVARRSLRMIRRKRAAIAVLALVFALAGFGFWQWRRVEIRNAEIVAQQERLKNVLAEFEKSAAAPDKPAVETVADIRKFKKAFIAELPRAGGDGTGGRQELVERGIRYLDRVASAPRPAGPMPPDLSLELADAYEQLAALQANMGGTGAPAKASSVSTMKKATTVLEACDASSPSGAAVQERLNRLRAKIQTLSGLPVVTREMPEPVTVEAKPSPVAAPPARVQLPAPRTVPAAASSQLPAPAPTPSISPEPPPPPAPVSHVSVELQERVASVESRVQVAEQSIEPVRKNLEAQGQTLSPTILADLSSMRVRLNQAKRAMAAGNEAAAQEHIAAARAFADRVLKSVGR